MVDVTAAPAPRARSAMRKVVLASLIGTTIEWYDFFLYGAAAALVFNKLFFPKSDPLTGAMLAFATYALGFVARPIGGVVFGHFGDRIGRKRLLMVSLVIMGLASSLIGVLPTYRDIGPAAAVLLTLLRLVQGFAVGGEWGGAVLLAGEHGDYRRRGFWAGWPQMGVPAGNLLAAGVLAVMTAMQSKADFLAWGWRIPFLLSAVLVAVGWWVRTRVEESPAFAAVVRSGARSSAPALEAIRERPGGIAVGAGLRFGENVSFYILTALSLTYATETAHLDRSAALNAVLIGAAAECLTLPLFAILSDRIGRRPVYAAGALGMAAWSVPFFAMIDHGGPVGVALAVTVGLVLHGAMYGPQAAFIAELFPTRLRYSGASIAYQLTSIIAGSLAPIIALSLLRAFGAAWPISAYVAAACAVSFAAALIARETGGAGLATIDAGSGRADAASGHSGGTRA